MVLALVEGVSGQPAGAALPWAPRSCSCKRWARGLVDAVESLRHEGGDEIHLFGALGGVALRLPGQRRSLHAVNLPL